MTNHHHKISTLIRVLVAGFGLAWLGQHSVGVSFGQTASHGQIVDNDQGMTDELNSILSSTQLELSSPRVKPELDDGRVQQIRDRIELLKSIIDDERKAAATTRNERKAAARKAETIEVPGQAPVSESITDDQTATLKPQEFVPSIDAEQLATKSPGMNTEPLDVEELAFSLYMTGNYSTAIKNLQEALKRKHTAAEAAWINCLMGCCYQMQQNFDDAERVFRKTTSQKSAAEISSKYSSWKLQYIEKRRSAIQAMQLIDAELKQYIPEEPRAK